MKLLVQYGASAALRFNRSIRLGHFACTTVAHGVGLSTRACEFPTVDDEVFLADRTTLQPAFENLARAGRIACLR
jgi:hypothetical protein